MSACLTSSFVKAASLACVCLFAGTAIGFAQTDLTSAPLTPTSPAPESAPQPFPLQIETAPTTGASPQPGSLPAPATETQMTGDTGSTSLPLVDATSTSVPVSAETETSLDATNSGPETTASGIEAQAEANTSTLTPHASESQLEQAAKRAMAFLHEGGPSIWAIAALSVITVALILWKIWRLALIGAWSRGKAQKAVKLYEDGETDAAQALLIRRKGLRSKVVGAAIAARETLTEDAAREETARVAKRELGEAAVGLRALELIATIAPLLGLLGTVLGMIAAFQALQESGSRADPSLLAGGIWEALLTTAAGMAVAIPASAALTWFEAVIDRIRRDVEDAAMRIFVTRKDIITETPQALAAE
jgi:biopolymer transport protein ExbB